MGNMIENLSLMDIDTLETEINKERKRLDAMVKLLNIRKSLGETTRHMRVARARAAMKREAVQKRQSQSQAQPQPQPQAQAQPQPQPQAQAQAQPQPQAQARPQPQPQPQVDRRIQQLMHTQPQTRVRPQAAAETIVQQSSPVASRPDPGQIVNELFGDDEQPVNGNGTRIY